MRTTQRVEKHVIKKNHQWFGYCDEITNASRKLFNTVQYTQRQSFFYGHGYLSQPKLDKLKRVISQAKGYFNISTAGGLVQGIKYDCCQPIQKKDGYEYRF